VAGLSPSVLQSGTISPVKPDGQSTSAGASWTVADSAAGVRLDKFLAAQDRLGSRGRVTASIDKGKVFLNGTEAGRADAGVRLCAGDSVRVWMDRPGSARRVSRSTVIGELEILHEDDALIVVNKPAGLLSVPLERKHDAPSVYDHIETHFRPHGKRRPFVVHRIDRDTSGLVVFAKTSRAKEFLKTQFRRRKPERVYLAVVYGHPQPVNGTWRDYLRWDSRTLIQKQTLEGDPHGKEAISRYRVIERFQGVSLLEVCLVTGKRNQIRLQADLHGHTLVGERRYVFGSESPRPIVFSRQALHAHRLSFRHPADDRVLCFEVALPADLAELCVRLRRGCP